MASRIVKAAVDGTTDASTLTLAAIEEGLCPTDRGCDYFKSLQRLDRKILDSRERKSWLQLRISYRGLRRRRLRNLAHRGERPVEFVSTHPRLRKTTPLSRCHVPKNARLDALSPKSDSGSEN